MQYILVNTRYIPEMLDVERFQMDEVNFNPWRIIYGKIAYKLTWGEFFTPLLFMYFY